MSGSWSVPIRSKEVLELMRKSGKITALALKKVIDNVRPGISLLTLDKIADEEIKRLGGEASFKTVPGYYFATCLTVNSEVVHGLPREIKLKEGDIIGIDIGAVYQGWHADAAWTVLVGDQCSVSSEQKGKIKFLEVGEKALWKAVSQAREGKRLRDISAAIQEIIEGAGYGVVKSYTGHGVGEKPHEVPEIPCYGEKGTGLKLKEGMTLALEVIYTEGDGKVTLLGDGWTAVASDGSLGGLFEVTVIVGKKKAEVITDWRQF